MSSEQGTDATSVIENLSSRGDSPPLHVHHTEDEIFHILDGELRFRVGDEELRARAGETLLAPKGVPHTYVVESERGRWLVSTAHGDFERSWGRRSAERLRRCGTVQEAHIETTPEGQVPVDGGWFILNLGEMAWETAPGFGAWLGFFAGAHVHVLQPGESNGLYHAEAAQEGFLVLAGECIAIVEGEERRMRPWDYFHSPPGTEHITVGAGDEPCAILMFGSSDSRRKVEWIANEVAAKHGASVAKTTSRDTEAYGDLPEIVRVRPPKPFGKRP